MVLLTSGFVKIRSKTVMISIASIWMCNSRPSNANTNATSPPIPNQNMKKPAVKISSTNIIQLKISQHNHKSKIITSILLTVKNILVLFYHIRWAFAIFLFFYNWQLINDILQYIRLIICRKIYSLWDRSDENVRDIQN